MITKAYRIAKEAHRGQVDKGGEDYILHPLTVADNVKTEDEKVVALLHDVVEDTYISMEDLSKEFPQNIIVALDLLTKKEGQNYEEYIEKIKENPLARTVKIADLEHNMRRNRIKSPTKQDMARFKKYEESYKELWYNL